MASAPGAIEQAWELIHQNIPEAQLGGIVGDVHHSFGYHLGRDELPPGDYSNILSLDKGGPSNMASALDITLPDNLMRQITARLHDLALQGDHRLRGLREFCGTLDGKHTFPWDLSNNASEGLDTWDDSHLWHIHLSGYRTYEQDATVWLDIATAFCGGKAVPNPRPSRWLRRGWPSFMPAGHYFGLISGPVQSHGGYYPVERPSVRAIQYRLHGLGFYNVGDKDGVFGPKTRNAVSDWQHHVAPKSQFFGQVWHDDWNRLFTY